MMAAGRGALRERQQAAWINSYRHAARLNGLAARRRRRRWQAATALRGAATKGLRNYAGYACARMTCGGASI